MDDDIKRAERGAQTIKDLFVGLTVLTIIFTLSALIFGYPPTLLWVLSPLWIPIGLIIAAVFGLMIFYVTLIVIYNVAEWLKNLSKKD